MSEARQLDLVKSKKKTLGYKKFEERLSKELFFVFVEPIGGGAKNVATVLGERLKNLYGYKVNTIRLSEIIAEDVETLEIEEPKLDVRLGSIQGLSTEAKRINKMQQWGNILREKKGFDFLGKKAVQRIADYRVDNGGLERASEDAPPVPKPRRFAHIITSVKHEEEFNILKSIYGKMLFLIAVSCGREKQIQNYLPKEDATKDNARIENEYDILSEIDQDEGIDNGQQVRDIFYQADLFLNGEQFEKTLDRF